ncbi:uncharacterized protein BP01DRAFT_414345 [Aspergillus saccharolyticus JOP 1030-1]|uniref:Rhodopsin domain-containing protein n=1 Tax=Aspergillus saccharolyticus JOP 1030-1 TaxID=1450539 RepID=A0A319A5X6_9EURO|nr:hypothetical protein BP01DRAFT_414345 [Aspergillus saccharolyticus JOP 1030-1]PYH47458.1 hypothetical protein BP01DRAFT_414345 [Aspergillus saccharolyticus JOP 1030-1]
MGDSRNHTCPALTSSPLTYDYRSSLRSEDILTQTVCLTVSTCCVGTRLYSKISITQAPGWEDCMYCPFAVRHGNDIHQWEVAASDLKVFSKLANASQILYGPLIYVTKLSILLLYLRLFAPSKRNTPFWLVQMLIWMNFLFYLADTIVKVCECRPRSKIWDQAIPGQCISINIPILVTSIVNVVSDFMMLLLPNVCVWRLQMTWRTKMGLSAVFAAGIFACICRVMRLMVSVHNRTTLDRTHDWFPEFLWTTAEITSGIVASCLPALPSFFRHSSQKAKPWVSNIGTGSSSTQVKNLVAAATDRRLGRAMWVRLRLWRSGRNVGGTESMADSYWEMGEVGAYQGICYTITEATAKRSVPDGIDVAAEDLSRSGEEHRPRTGILKIVEVDVETGPERER